MAKQSIKVKGIEIRLLKDNSDYICLTDIAKGFEDEEDTRNKDFLILNWLRNGNTIVFLGEWERAYNTNFNPVEFDRIRMESSVNSFRISVKKWIARTNATGMEARPGRYGGTFAHRDIAVQFCFWLSPTFQVYLVKEFQRLKEDEAKRLNIEWNIRRELAKAHYPMLKEAVLNHLPQQTGKSGFYLAHEADLINQIVFGMTAKQWRAKKPNTGKQNMRDFATVEQLLLVSDLQVVDSLLIKWDSPKEQRIELLEKFASDLRRHYRESKPIQRIKEIQDRALK